MRSAERITLTELPTFQKYTSASFLYKRLFIMNKLWVSFYSPKKRNKNVYSDSAFIHRNNERPFNAELFWIEARSFKHLWDILLSLIKLGFLVGNRLYALKKLHSPYSCPAIVNVCTPPLSLLLAHVPDLTHLCRLAVRAAVGSKALSKPSFVQRLPVPALLQDYLQFSDVFSAYAFSASDSQDR